MLETENIERIQMLSPHAKCDECENVAYHHKDTLVINGSAVHLPQQADPTAQSGRC